MIKFSLLIYLISASLAAVAQHCPWDCSGMIQVEVTASKSWIKKLNPVLVDEDKRVVIDTVYGSANNTYDTCDLLSYDDFMNYRRKKIATEHWYEFDTLYQFAKGKYIIRYNYCKYREKKLFLRYNDPYSRSPQYHYIEIPSSNRIHLHDFNNELRQKQTKEMTKATKEHLFSIDCKTWGLRNKDCP